MIFNTFAYFALFLIPAAVLFRLARPAWQPWICFLFGIAFFVFFSLTQVGGVAGAFCLGIFIWESLFSRLYKPGSVLCLVGIAQTLLFLIIFKYWNFLTGLVFAPLGRNPVAWSGAFLPLGISFFTFEFIHYAVDRYRGVAPAGRFRDYCAFIMFFPTMVAGPIKRYQDFLPKLSQPSLDWRFDWQQGATRILAGLAKKFAIADLLTAFTNHLNQHDIARAQRWVLPLWLLAYGIKIYADFSAYSDIAIGSARLFGIRVPENFDWPYLRVNIAEFWRHWHISLYRWLVDYVFIPLGGSRRSQPRVYLNVLITMFLSGLWHGAGWNFIVWGLWHGMLLCGHRVWSRWRAAQTRQFETAATAVPALQPALTPLAAAGPGNLALAYALNPAEKFRAGSSSNRPTGSLSYAGQPSSPAISGGGQPPASARLNTSSGSVGGTLLSWALTFVLVNLGWAFFCMDLRTSLFFFRRLFFG